MAKLKITGVAPVYKSDNLELLISFQLANVQIQVGGRPTNVVDLLMTTTTQRQPQPRTRPPVRLREDVLAALIEDLSGALQRLRGTYVSPPDATKH